MKIQKKPYFNRNDFEGWLFATPWFCGYIAFNLFPLLFALLVSFSNWDGVAQVFGDNKFF